MLRTNGWRRTASSGVMTTTTLAETSQYFTLSVAHIYYFVTKFDRQLQHFLIFTPPSSPIQQPDKQDIGRLGAAAKRCRQQYAHQPPFHDWVAVILCMHPKRQDCYER